MVFLLISNIHHNSIFLGTTNRKTSISNVLYSPILWALPTAV
jgi:hypothetical protein